MIFTTTTAPVSTATPPIKFCFCAPFTMQIRLSSRLQRNNLGTA